MALACLSLLLLLVFTPNVNPATNSQQITTPASADSFVLVGLPTEDNVDIRVPLYSMDDTGEEMICPVTDSVLLQPPALQAPFGSGGSFSVQSSTMDLFSGNPSAMIKHILQACQSVPDGRCDVLLMTGLLSLGTGSFVVRYSAANSTAETLIFYGPEGLSLFGRADDEPVTVPPNLMFVLRISSTTMSSPGKATLCESLDGGNFTESTILSVRNTRALTGCRNPIRSIGLVAPGNITIVLSKDAILSPREIKVKLGPCDSNEWESLLLNVTAGAGGMATTTMETIPDTTFSSTIATTSTTTPTTTPTTTAFISTTVAFTSTTITKTTTAPTLPPTTLPSSDTATGGGVSNIIVFSLVGVGLVTVVLVVVVAAGALCCERRRRRRKTKDKPKKTSTGDVVDLEMDKISDEHPVSGSLSWNGQNSFTVAVNLGSGQASDILKEMHRGGGSFSETESEGSEVTLMKHAKETVTLLTHNKEVLNYIAGKIDGHIIGSYSEEEQVAHL